MTMSLYTGNNSGLMSSLFGPYKNSLFGSLSSSLSDYSMIRSGAYGKLMKAYYAKEADTTQKTDKTDKTKKNDKTAQMSTQEKEQLQQMQPMCGSLVNISWCSMRAPRAQGLSLPLTDQRRKRKVLHPPMAQPICMSQKMEAIPSR